MTDIIERAAKAAYEEMVRRSGYAPDIHLCSWLEQMETVREDWRGSTRAAIKAMRIPSEAMQEAFCAQEYSCCYG